MTIKLFLMKASKACGHGRLRCSRQIQDRDIPRRWKQLSYETLHGRYCGVPVHGFSWRTRCGTMQKLCSWYWKFDSKIIITADPGKCGFPGPRSVSTRCRFLPELGAWGIDMICPMARRLRLLTHGLKTARRAPRALVDCLLLAIKTIRWIVAKASRISRGMSQ